MKAVMISIRHRYAEKIYAGTKHCELRKRIPAFDSGTICFIYEPFPVSRVTGFFVYDYAVRADKKLVWFMHHDKLGVTHEEFDIYYAGRDEAVLWFFCLPCPFKKPVSLKEFGLSRPPQSYCYVEV